MLTCSSFAIKVSASRNSLPTALANLNATKQYRTYDLRLQIIVWQTNQLNDQLLWRLILLRTWSTPMDHKCFICLDKLSTRFTLWINRNWLNNTSDDLTISHILPRDYFVIFIMTTVQYLVRFLLSVSQMPYNYEWYIMVRQIEYFLRNSFSGYALIDEIMRLIIEKYSFETYVSVASIWTDV